jgi:hypothetical protein
LRVISPHNISGLCNWTVMKFKYCADEFQTTKVYISHITYPPHVMRTVRSGFPKGGKPWVIRVSSLASMNYPGGCSRIDQTLTSHWRHAPNPVCSCPGGGSAKEPQTGWSMRLKGKRQILSLSVLIRMPLPAVQFGAIQETYCINCRRLAPYVIYQQGFPKPSRTRPKIKGRMHSDREGPP